MSDNSSFQVTQLFDVKDWVTVVTGGGTGIGLMITQALANNGAKVYIVGRRKHVLDKVVETYGSSLSHESGRIIAVEGDVANKESIVQLVQEISKHEKHIDLLVNNAGIEKGHRDVDKGDGSAKALSEELMREEWEDWSQIFDTNVTGYFFTSAAFLPLLAESTGKHRGHSASIINISSISGLLNVSQHHPNYNVSKAATIQLNSLLAQEFSRPGVKVRVNSIAPGVFPSEMTAGKSHDETKKSSISAEGYREDKNVPAGRPGKDEDMAQAVLALAVNQYISGQTLVVDGGYLLGNP